MMLAKEIGLKFTWVQVKRRWADFTIARKSIAASLFSAQQALLAILSGIIISRWLGPDGRGEISTLIIWLQLSTWVATFGLGRGIIYYLNTDTIANVNKGSIYSGLMAYGLFTGLLVWALAGSTIGFRWFGIDLGIFLALAFPLYLVSDLLGNFVLGLKNYQLYNMKRLIESAAYALLLYIAMLNGWLNLEVVAYSAVVSLVLSILLTIVAIRIRMDVRWAMPKLLHIKHALSYGVKTHKVDLPKLIYKYAPLAVITPIYGTYIFGLYSVAITVSSLIGMLSSSVASIALPELSGKSKSEQRVEIKRVMTFSMIVFLVSGVMLEIVSGKLIPIVFGKQFEESVTIARYMISAAAFGGVGAVVQSIMYALGEPSKMLAVVGWASGFVAVAFMVIAEQAGTSAMAISIMIGSVVEMILGLTILNKQLSAISTL